MQHKKYKKEGVTMTNDNKKVKNNLNTDQKENEEVLSSDELDMVSGGTSLRNVDKVKPTDIGDNTKSKI